MAKLNPAQAAAKYLQKLQGSGEAYVAGTNGTQKDPIQLAIAAAPRWFQGVQEAAADQRFEKGLQGTNKQAWQRACSEKGKAALVASAKLAAEKWQKREAAIAPGRDAAVAALPARGSYEQNKQRALAMMDSMHALKGTR